MMQLEKKVKICKQILYTHKLKLMQAYEIELDDKIAWEA